MKYLAITIAGAVSLGSYEAGAMYEIIDAICQHNSNPDTAKNRDFIHIDVLTGASAGGMTAAILGQRLLYARNTFKSAYDNPLYDVWVKGISLSALIDTTDRPVAQGGDPATLSLLSSNLITRIARQALLQKDEQGQIPLDGGPHNGVDLERGIRLGLALTNINGVNYGYPLIGGGRFQYTEFSDQMLRLLSANDRSPQPWQEISEAAIACGAFPFAFRAKDLVRARQDYEPTPPLETWPSAGDSCVFTYTDGGVLQNQPLGMAKNLVDLNDKHLGTDDRFYLFISPHPMAGQDNSTLRESNTDLLRMGKRLVDIYLNQAVFRDWIQASQVNEQIELLDARAAALAGAMAAGTLDASVLSAASEDILRLLYASNGSGEPRASAEARLSNQYRSEVASLGGLTDPRAVAFLRSVLALEKAADLGERDRMQIYGVLPQRATLAGAGLCAFVGFFDQKFRDHDYDQGRSAAQQLLTSAAMQSPGALGPIRYRPEPIRPIDTRLNGLVLRDVPNDDVDILRRGLKDRVNSLVGDCLKNPLERYPAQLGADLLLSLLVDWEFSRNVQE